MTERTPGSHPALPEPEQVVALLEADFARAGYEVDDVRIDRRARPPRITVVADGDRPLDLDTIAELSRAASDRLDALDTAVDGYLLEVTSPGVDRPLTAEKHFRRARGRRVAVRLSDGGSLDGRLGAVTDGVAELVLRERGGFSVRRIPLADIRDAVVQVEFSPPNPRELELAGVRDDAAPNGTEADA